MIPSASTEYSDSIVKYHQYKHELGITNTEAKSHPDTQEVFFELIGVVEEYPELILAYTGVQRCRGNNRREAIENVREIEDTILDLSLDVGIISSLEHSKRSMSLDDNGIKDISKQFVKLFKDIIPPELLPKKPAKRKRIKNNQIASSIEAVDEDMDVVLIDGNKLIFNNIEDVDPTDTQTELPTPTNGIKNPFDYNTDSAANSLAVQVRNLDTAEKALAGYIVFGRLTAGINLTVYSLQRVMRTLVGTDEMLTVRGATKRFEMCNDFILGKHGKGTTIARSSNRDQILSDIGPSFSHPQAACSTGRNDNDIAARLEWWFPGRGESTSLQKIKCFGCSAIDACLEFSIAHPQKFGIWGGASERERRALRGTMKKSGRASFESRVVTYRKRSAERLMSFIEVHADEEDKPDLEFNLLRFLDPDYRYKFDTLDKFVTTE